MAFILGKAATSAVLVSVMLWWTDRVWLFRGVATWVVFRLFLNCLFA